MSGHSTTNFFGHGKKVSKKIVSISLTIIGIILVSIISNLPLGYSQSPILAITSTTTQQLTPFITNQIFTSSRGCFLNQSQGTSSYTFKPNGLMYWSNDLQGNNITITSLVFGSTLIPSPFKNSTTIDYKFNVLNTITADLYFKLLSTKNCAGNSSNSFKIKLIGNVPLGGTFIFNLGNPNNGIVTCDNTNHIITINTVGINFTDSKSTTQCVNALNQIQLTITLPLGNFNIDPITITTSTSNPATGLPAQRNIWFAQTRWWFFFVISGEFEFSTCVKTTACDTSASNWATPTDLGKTVSVNGFSTWYDSTSNVICYARENAAGSNFNSRCGTPQSGGTITWSYNDLSTTTTGTSPVGPYIYQNETRLYITINTQQAGVGHEEIYTCTDADDSTTCGTSLTKQRDISDTKFSVLSVLLPMGGENYELVLGQFSGSGFTPIMYNSATAGFTWAASQTAPSALFFSSWSCNTITSTAYCSGNDGASDNMDFGSCANPCGSGMTSSNICSTCNANSGSSTTMTNDASTTILIFYQPVGTTSLDACKSTNTGSTWTCSLSVSTSEVLPTNANFGLTTEYQYSTTTPCAPLGWTGQTASPFNIRFTVYPACSTSFTRSITDSFTFTDTISRTVTNTRSPSDSFTFTNDQINFAITHTTTTTSTTTKQYNSQNLDYNQFLPEVAIALILVFAFIGYMIIPSERFRR